MHPGQHQTALIDANGVRQMDAAFVRSGGDLKDLITRAGRAVAGFVGARFSAGARVAVLAGPGHNGEDACVAAQILARDVDVSLFVLESDRRRNHHSNVKVQALESFESASYDCIVDGLFGVGLARPVEGMMAEVVAEVSRSSAFVIAIDLPSGVDGTTGQVLGAAICADATVTFERRKAGHLLMPGRSLCGELVVAELGISATTLNELTPIAYANEPALWLGALKQPGSTGHKYDRGHAVVMSGPPSKSGAARLSAMAALRGGSGLVSLAAPTRDLAALAAQTTAIMLRSCDDERGLDKLLTDERLNAFVIGPGFGDLESAFRYAARIIAAERHLVLDADAITAFQDSQDELFALLHRHGMRTVLTPHEGEFRRLFKRIAKDASSSKLEKAKLAASESGAIVVLKGADTIIADPEGRAAINDVGTPWLATAGTGDVLTGIIAAQMAQGTPPFEAACIGVWMHGRAAELFGPGLISEDLPDVLPRVHTELAGMLPKRQQG